MLLTQPFARRNNTRSYAYHYGVDVRLLKQGSAMVLDHLETVVKGGNNTKAPLRYAHKVFALYSAYFARLLRRLWRNFKPYTGCLPLAPSTVYVCCWEGPLRYKRISTYIRIKVDMLDIRLAQP